MIPNSKMRPTDTPEWKALEEHYGKIKHLHLKKLFADDPERADKFTFKAAGLYVDFSKNRIIQPTLQLLLRLAKNLDMRREIDLLFTGNKINRTENRAVLHTALRNCSNHPVFLEGKDIMPEVNKVILKMETLAKRIKSGKWLGYTGKRIKNIINIGIGGSNLGPAMVYEALKYYSDRELIIEYISNIDATHITEQLKNLNPEETLFIICSKSFATQETMANAETAKNWLLTVLKDKAATKNHFIAVSANQKKVKEFGIEPENMLEFWDWVGGRYSLTSAIGFSLMIALGITNFHKLRAGFHQMDQHFRQTPLEKNLPVILALVGIWNNNFLGSETQAILPYDQYLQIFPAFIQQGDMESNGKNVDRQGLPTDYQTGPIIWGKSGTNGQHAFFQLLHQGTKLIPCDFIGFAKPLNPCGDHHQRLMANFFAQQEALAFGRNRQELEKDYTPKELIPYKLCEGNRPSTCIMAEKLTPESLGSLIALYEHKIFVQGVIWNIFSFDQWGVELGKQLADKILPELKNNAETQLSHDSSTNNLIRYYLLNS